VGRRYRLGAAERVDRATLAAPKANEQAPDALASGAGRLALALGSFCEKRGGKDEGEGGESKNATDGEGHRSPFRGGTRHMLACRSTAASLYSSVPKGRPEG
jgi:hypothetical protein